MPTSSLPRLPCEEKDPEPYSLIVVVISGKVQLQHKASCYRGHGYSNRLNSLHRCTTVQPARSDLQGDVHLVRERSTEAIRHIATHPRLSREAIRRTISYALRGLGPSPLLHGAGLAGETKANPNTPATAKRQHRFPAIGPQYC